jgi:hypothetical protein
VDTKKFLGRVSDWEERTPSRNGGEEGIRTPA